ncbi:P antigen family member 3 [Macaca fascicularis]|uniref:P antigen family member 3 n=1 Tax=Macaca fascicularis TaxID=9541 RepID=UPI0032B0882A
MSGHQRTRSRSRERRDDQDSNHPIGAVVAQEPPSDDQLQQQEPPIESQDYTPGQERDEGALEFQDLAAYLWELTRSKTGGERGDGPNVKGEFLPNLEPVKIPEAVPQFDIESEVLGNSAGGGSSAIEKSIIILKVSKQFYTQNCTLRWGNKEHLVLNYYEDG